MLLEMANYDALRAQEIEGKLTQEWWERWLLDRKERINAANHRRKHKKNG